MAGRRGVLAAGNMLVDHVHRINAWPQPGWLSEITHSEKSVGGAPLNVLLTLAKMQTGLPLAAVGLTGKDADGEFIRQMLEQHQVEHDRVLQTMQDNTSMSQVMTEPSGQRTFFHATAANRWLDLDAFADLETTHRLFHLGYLLLLESLDKPDDEYGTRSARLLAQMQRQGYQTSLDLVSRQGDTDYRRQVLPALRWLDYLVINELEAGAFTGLTLRDAQGRLQTALMPQAARELQQEGVRQRVVIHAPEGAFGLESSGEGVWVPSWTIPEGQIVGSVGAGDAFCAGVLYASHEGWPLRQTLHLAHTCACFNLRAANAIDGIRPLAEMQDFMANAPSGDMAGQ